jgi:UDP-glucose 4-epimerase
MRTELGFEPSYSTAQAFADFAAAAGSTTSPVERLVDGLLSSLADPAPMEVRDG